MFVAASTGCFPDLSLDDALDRLADLEYTRVEVAISEHGAQLKPSQVAANLEEADDGSSRRDFRAKDRIALRELKESRLHLRILRRTGYLTDKDDVLIQESVELVNIVATIIRNSERMGLDLGIWNLGFTLYRP